MTEEVFISIIIPCLNEQKFIGKCLDSVLANDYPKDRLEILVIDGMSEDGTREILESYAQRYPFLRILHNPGKIIPVALNLGVKNAKGEVIIRMDAHSTYSKTYLSKCVAYLNKYNADNVGGIWITVPRNNSLWATAIALSLSHFFGVGNSHYRIGRSKEPRWVDTVPYGCFRKDVFDKIGFFDESYHRNEDIEFNARLRKSGGKILLVPEIVIHYYPRSTLRTFWKHNFDNGLGITYALRLNRVLFSWRHLAPLVFMASLIGSLGLWGLLSLSVPPGLLSSVRSLSLRILLTLVSSYALCNFFFSVQICIKEKRIVYLPIMPIVFAVLHVSHGIGSVVGLTKATLSRFFRAPLVTSRNREGVNV